MTFAPERYKDLKVLVTGGLGFLGSNLSLPLYRLGAKVSVMDSLAKGGRSFGNGDYRRATDILGWQPQTALEEGLRKTVNFFQKRREDYW